jgi:catechol 2,3-dioxygenase-like lactoylglutathione lyase family enzyme
MVVVAIVMTAAPPLASAQTPPSSVVVNIGNFLHFVANVDKAASFYGDLVGLGLPAAPQGGRTFIADPAILKLHNAVGGQYRVVTANVPGAPEHFGTPGIPVGIELVEYKGVPRNPVHPRIQDPGAATLVLLVRDLDAPLARLKKAGATVLSEGGRAVTFNGESGRSRSVLIQDPDGFFVELLQTDPAPKTMAPAASNIIGGRFAMTVTDAEKAAQTFRDALGFPPGHTTPFAADTAGRYGLSARGTQFRKSTLPVPNVTFEVEFFEFRGVERKPLRTDMHQPGMGAFRFDVRDISGSLKTLLAAGAKVETAGGVPIRQGTSLHVAVRDPNDDMYLELSQRNVP